jgi:dihydroorotate dehydrogenase (fumarate)
MDLSTKYMGLELSCPLVASAGPLSKKIENIKALADAGAGAVVMHSIFEEQLEQEALALNYYLERGTEQFAEALTYYPPMESFKVGPQLYLENIEQAKAACKIPVIASLNGISTGGWTNFAKDIESAGADAIELNVYMIPTNPAINSSVIEKVFLDILETVKASVRVPVAVKLSPFFSAFANMAKRLDQSRADALVLFNRFYQPDIDLAEMDVRPRLVLSNSEDIRLPLRWIAILYGKLHSSLAASSGVHTGADAAKLILAGADVVMMTSALLKNGIAHMAKVRQDLTDILAQRGYENLH